MTLLEKIIKAKEKETLCNTCDKLIFPKENVPFCKAKDKIILPNFPPTKCSQRSDK